MSENKFDFKKAHIIAARAKAARKRSRLAVRDQTAPDGEIFVGGYVSGKGSKAAKGYESWLVTEMPKHDDSEWRRIHVRVDASGTCRFDLTWNGERFAGGKTLDALQEKHPRLAKTAIGVMQSREFSRETEA
jgi:hypothetical protein